MPNDNREAQVYSAMYTLLTGLTDPTFKKVYKVPPSVTEFATPSAWLWFMTSTGRHGPRADNAKKWRFEVALRMVCPILYKTTPEQSFAQLRTQFENALDGSSTIKALCNTVQTSDWSYMYEGTEEKGVAIGVGTTVVFTWLNVASGGN